MRSPFSFFFFKQRTAYEGRIIDWSSDVCSSDLHDENADPALGFIHEFPLNGRATVGGGPGAVPGPPVSRCSRRRRPRGTSRGRLSSLSRSAPRWEATGSEAAYGFRGTRTRGWEGQRGQVGGTTGGRRIIK